MSDCREFWLQSADMTYYRIKVSLLDGTIKKVDIETGPMNAQLSYCVGTLLSGYSGYSE